MAIAERDETSTMDKPLSVSFGSPKSVVSTVHPGFEKIGKSVRFAMTSKQFDNMSSPTSIELTENDIISLWYTEAEYGLFKRSHRFIVKLMETDLSSVEEDEELCPRGLEAKTTLGYRKKIQAIEDAWNAVMFEQDKQFRENSFSPSRLARLYHEVAAPCSMEAFIRGKQDEKYVAKLAKDSL
jgi:hypothetical protein